MLDKWNKGDWQQIKAKYDKFCKECEDLELKPESCMIFDKRTLRLESSQVRVFA